jgi:hypothetical protein
MAEKPIVLIACVCVLLGVCTGAPAQTFGDLHARPETPTTAHGGSRGGFLADPTIARWLSSLPASASLNSATPDPAIALMLDASPIGGEVYRFATASEPVSIEAAAANPKVQIFDASPIGGTAYSIERLKGASQRVAENVVKQGPAKEGRSASRSSHRCERPMQPKKKMMISRASGQRGLATGRSAAASPRYVPALEGQVDVPAPRGPAMLWGVMLFTGW